MGDLTPFYNSNECKMGDLTPFYMGDLPPFYMTPLYMGDLPPLYMDPVVDPFVHSINEYSSPNGAFKGLARRLGWIYQSNIKRRINLNGSA